MYLLSYLDLCCDYCHVLLATAIPLPAFNVIEQPMVKIANRKQIVLYLLLSPLLGIAQMVDTTRRLAAYGAQAVVTVKALLAHFCPRCGVDVFAVSHNLAAPDLAKPNHTEHRRAVPRSAEPSTTNPYRKKRQRAVTWEPGSVRTIGG